MACLHGLRCPAGRRADRSLWPLPHPACLQDANALLAAQRDLKAALARSQREAAQLAAQLERAAAQVEEARQEAAQAQAAAAAAGSRSKLLQQAWEAALWREQE